MRILVVAPSWIGDTILAQPLLMRLKQLHMAQHMGQHQGVRIEVLAPDWSAPLLARMAEVDAVIVNPFAHGEFKLGARRELGRRLRGTARNPGFQAAYVLPNSWKSALVPFFAGIPRRIGYQGEARYGLLTERHRLDSVAHPQLVQRYAALAGPLDEGELPRPQLRSSIEQQRTVRRQLQLPEDVAPIILCPGAEYGPAKRWPVEHFAELARKLGAGGTAIWILGSSKDVAVSEDIVQRSGGAALNLCGRTTLEQAIDLIASARHVVSNDSGLMHVAAALDRPLTALYGSSSPLYTPPLSPAATLLSRSLACSPCFQRECRFGHLDCLHGITVDAVVGSMKHRAAGPDGHPADFSNSL